MLYSYFNFENPLSSYGHPLMLLAVIPILSMFLVFNNYSSPGNAPSNYGNPTNVVDNNTNFATVLNSYVRFVDASNNFANHINAFKALNSYDIYILFMPIMYILLTLTMIMYVKYNTTLQKNTSVKFTANIWSPNLNPCPAELFQLYFSSFEAGIANAISSFKWRKI